jgi:hypothetical protein
MGRKKRATAAAEVLEGLFQPELTRLWVRCLSDRSRLIFASAY